MRLAAFCVALLLAQPAVAVEKVALAVYHFNVQYVEGGLIGYPDGVSSLPRYDLDDEQVQDQIISQSFDPLLEMYARHPSWGCDIELQGYMLDVIAARHPETLAMMQSLAAAGQVSFDSFHWSDQFWLAYPRADLEYSHDLVVQSFQAAKLPLGSSVFTQEGQFAMGMERFFRERGIRTAVVAGGVMGSTIANFEAQPLYTLGTMPDVLAVVASGSQDSLVQVTWDYLNDGELAMTNGLDPYTGEGFVYNATAAQAYEQQLENEETAGYAHLSVASYVEKALALGEQPQPLPAVVDGVWHHDVSLWMGEPGLYDTVGVAGTSQDNACHTLAMQAHRKLTEAAQVVTDLKTHAFDAKIAQAWKDLLLGEGSDGTGQNPWLGEREYSQTHSRAALDAANTILADRHVAPYVKPAAAAPHLQSDPGPFQLIYDPAAYRVPTIAWQKRAGTTIWELTVSWPAVPEGSTDPGRYHVELSFPRTFDDLVYCGALEEQTIITTPLASISGAHDTLPDGGSETFVPVPAANGLVGLGDNMYVIKRTETVHVAAELPTGNEIVRFRDWSAIPGAITWQFVVVQGKAADALAEATADNIAPPAVKVSRGCQALNADAGGLLLALLAIASRRRRRCGGSGAVS
jgi:hypothetical protein